MERELKMEDMGRTKSYIPFLQDAVGGARNSKKLHKF